MLLRENLRATGKFPVLFQKKANECALISQGFPVTTKLENPTFLKLKSMTKREPQHVEDIF